MTISSSSRWHSLEFIYFIGIWSIFFSIGSVILYFIVITERSTYIDEIFHAGQCDKYCRGDFHYYDPKITTPPGLYVITMAVLYPLSKLLQTDLCSLNVFRSFNFIISQLNFVLLHQIVHDRMREFSSLKKLLISLNLSLLPVLFFFSFFYYTDTMSTFLVLLTYHLYNKNQSFSAGLSGLFSVMIRQTNLVWFCCFSFIKCCEIVNAEALRVGRPISKSEQRKGSYPLVIVKESFYLLRFSFSSFVVRILKETHFLIISIFSFIYFLIENGSIVFGDKLAHQPVIHVPQLFYFSLFTCIFAFPVHILPSIKFLRNIKRRKLLILVFVLIISLVVNVNTMAHLYLISDNRHYTFYIWKRIFEKHFGRYLVIPFYIVSMYSIANNINHLDTCRKYAYLVSSVICLVPQKLFELRYFIIPYLIYRIETCRKVTQWQLILELLFNLLMNYSTIALFLFNPFQWPDGSIQRFSW